LGNQRGTDIVRELIGSVKPRKRADIPFHPRTSNLQCCKAAYEIISKMLRKQPSENGILRAQTGKQDMVFNKAKDRLEYFVACVTEFADAFGLDYQKSFDYLDKHCGMDFLMKCYEAEHTVSFADAVNDLQRVCRRNGGHL
jgi:hypothetical protein